MLDIHRLRLLHEFAVRGSIAATAQALGYSASAVSQQLSTLEHEAGTSLLDRTARSAELTQAGKRLAEHAERILGEVELAEAELAASHSEPSGRVSVTAIPTAAVALAPLVTRRLRRHPELTLVFRQSAVHRGLGQLRSGEIDIALVDDWSGRLAAEHPRLHVSYLGRDPLVLAVPRDHPLAERSRIRLADLANQAWIAAPAEEPSRQALDALLARTGGQAPPPWEFQGLDTVLSLVAQGLGIALVPRLAATTKHRSVVLRELPGKTQAREVYALSRPSGARRPAVAAVLEALRRSADELRARFTPLD